MKYIETGYSISVRDKMHFNCCQLITSTEKCQDKRHRKTTLMLSIRNVTLTELLLMQTLLNNGMHTVEHEVNCRSNDVLEWHAILLSHWLTVMSIKPWLCSYSFTYFIASIVHMRPSIHVWYKKFACGQETVVDEECWPPCYFDDSRIMEGQRQFYRVGQKNRTIFECW